MHNPQKFLEIIKSPYETDKASLAFLRKISDRYPYCQTAQILLAKNLQQLFKPEFEQQVNKASAYAVNRRKFQRFIADRDKPEPIAEKPAPTVDDFLTPKQEQPEELKHIPEEPQKESEQLSETEITVSDNQVEKTEQTIIPENTESVSDINSVEVHHDSIPSEKDEDSEKLMHDDMFIIEEKKDKLSLLEIVKKRLKEINSKKNKASEKEESEKPSADLEKKEEKPINDSQVLENKTHNLHRIDFEARQKEKPKPKIPDFIYGKQAKKPDINYLIDKFLKEEPRIKVKKDLPEEQEDLSAASTAEDPQLATETLALVYLKQDKKKEALDVYEKLCLKFPEKSSYFAKKILDIKNEINP